ncbi:hypothetical protein H5410_029953 [Solanum commersonii]|uniref:Uncharacterized protein n=1 Tax=Solanum commersonii TaxID=4109 RepID=A0A9J5YFJ1_SOLCO|nr:hypothetical protein H5410_029953 [Solanum commersonii]
MTCIIEERLTSLTKAIEGLTKCAHKQDAKLFKLTNKMNNMIERRSSQAPPKFSKIQEEGESCLWNCFIYNQKFQIRILNVEKIYW